MPSRERVVMTYAAPSGALLRDALGPASMPLDATTADPEAVR